MTNLTANVERRPLGDLATFINGYAFKPSDWADAGLPIIRIQNLTGTQNKFNRTTRDVNDKYRIENGDLLISWSASLGAYIWDGGPALLNQHIFKAAPTANVDKDYLYFAIQHVLDVLRAKTHGSTMQHVKRGDFEGTSVPFPSTSEQHRIVDILKRADGIRRLRKQAQDTAGQLIPALFVDLFGDPATNPKGLPEIELGEVIVEGPQNGLYKPASAYGDGTRILRIDGFYDGAVTDWNSLRRLRLDDEEIAKYRLNPQDIIINRVNSPDYLGKSAIVEGLEGDVVFESNMMRFAIDQKRVDPHYLICHVQLDSIKRQVLSKAKHAINQSSINQKDVKSLRILLPDIESQGEFANRVHEIRSISIQQQMAEGRAQMVFESALQRAFSGTL